MKLKLKYDQKVHFIAETRNFSNIHIDEPESFHGTDLGPSSVEYFLIGIGGCAATTFVYCLNKNGVLVKDLEVIIDSKIGHAEPDKRMQIKHVEIEIKYSLMKEDHASIVEECKRTLRDYCVVNRSILKGFDVKVEVKKIKKN